MADGYRLTVEPDAVDAVRFERLVGQARNEEDPRRVRLLREALALWRGAAMQDVGLQGSAAFDAAVARLEGLRLAQVLVGIADLALRREQYEQAARLPAASTGVRGLPDRSQPDVARIEQTTQEGMRASWPRSRSPVERGMRPQLNGAVNGASRPVVGG